MKKKKKVALLYYRINLVMITFRGYYHSYTFIATSENNMNFRTPQMDFLFRFYFSVLKRIKDKFNRIIFFLDIVMWL